MQGGHVDNHMQTAVAFFNNLTTSDNPTTALLAALVVVLSGVVVYQWRYTLNQTVPKWIWDSFSHKFEQILDSQKQMTTIIDERLKK